MHVNVTEYHKGRRDTLEAIKQIGGEQVSRNFDRSLRASESAYARGAREVVWAWRLSQHPSGRKAEAS